MKVLAGHLRPGNIIEIDDKLYSVTDYETSQPGKGGAVIQIEMRDIRNGNKDKRRFRTQETVDRVRLDQTEFQYLYGDSDGRHFMNSETYEQIVVSDEIIGAPSVFLQDGMTVTVETYEGEPLGVELPPTVTLEVTEAEPVIKGQTATTSYKPAIVENGERVMVPPHIERGTRIVIKTEDGSYVERAKD